MGCPECGIEVPASANMSLYLYFSNSCDKMPNSFNGVEKIEILQTVSGEFIILQALSSESGQTLLSAFALRTQRGKLPGFGCESFEA
jgi:hypothetical protein